MSDPVVRVIDTSDTAFQIGFAMTDNAKLDWEECPWWHPYRKDRLHREYLLRCQMEHERVMRSLGA